MTHSQLYQWYVREGMTIQEIARAQGVSADAVRQALIEHAIPRRRRGPRRDIPAHMITPQMQAQLTADVATIGVSATAARHGVSRDVLHALRGVRPLPRGQRPRVDDLLVRTRYDAGIAAGQAATMVVANLARDLHCSVSTIRRSLRRTCVVAPSEPLPGAPDQGGTAQDEPDNTVWSDQGGTTQDDQDGALPTAMGTCAEQDNQDGVPSRSTP